MSYELGVYLQERNKELKEGKNIDRFPEWLDYFHREAQKLQIIFCAKVMPKLKTVDDLIPFKEHLNRLISMKNYRELEISMRLGGTQMIKYQNRDTAIHIQVKVKRKSMINFCYGNECFTKGIRYAPDKLFAIKCCAFHSYCRPCLFKYVINCLRKNPNGNMPCEGCSLVGTINSSNQIKSITQSEIDSLIPRDERIKYFEESHRRNFLTKCESRLPYCPNKEEFIEKTKIITYQCGDKVCIDCDALSTIYYIFEIVNCVIQAPQNYSNYEPVGIMCANRHLETLKKEVTVEDLKDKFNGRKIPKEWVDQALFLYEQNFQYFTGKSFIYCSGCNKLYAKNIDKTSCKECKKCFLCGLNEHPELTCDQFQNISNNFLSFGPEKSRDGYRDDPELLKLTEIFNNGGLDNYKITSFKMINPPQLILYYNNKIKKLNNNKSAYVFSDIFQSAKEAHNYVYQEVKESNIKGIYAFNVKFSRDSGEGGLLIVYRITFLNSAINRTPNESDSKTPYLLYTSGNKAYLSSRESALPFALVRFSRLV